MFIVYSTYIHRYQCIVFMDAVVVGHIRLSDAITSSSVLTFFVTGYGEDRGENWLHTDDPALQVV